LEIGQQFFYTMTGTDSYLNLRDNILITFFVFEIFAKT